MTQKTSLLPAEPRLIPLGDAAILVRFGESIDPQTLGRVGGLLKRLEAQPFPGLIEATPAYATVAVFYDPLQVLFPEARVHLQRILDSLGPISDSSDNEARIVEIPVCYGGEFGPDLEFVAAHNRLTPEEVVEIHSGAEYLVYMIGFAPGFPYLGGMPEKIAAPRRPSPRLRIPAGSVGIAGSQTGVYPLATPGGWQLIGRTPHALFRPEMNPPSLLRAGDRVRFCPITAEQFVAWRQGLP